MANFDVALQWALDFEDPQRKYAVVPDVGGYAVAGVNSHVFPSTVRTSGTNGWNS